MAETFLFKENCIRISLCTVYICNFATSMSLIIIVISAKLKPLQISCRQEDGTNCIKVTDLLALT